MGSYNQCWVKKGFESLAAYHGVCFDSNLMRRRMGIYCVLFGGYDQDMKVVTHVLSQPQTETKDQYY